MPTPQDFELPTINPRPKRKPPPPGKGRIPGSTNKLTKDLRHGIIEAAERIGRDGDGEDGLIGFLEDLGRYHKRSFTSLLVKLLPLQTNSTNVSAHIGELRIVSVPAGHFLSAEQIVQANDRNGPLQIEHDAPQIDDVQEVVEQVVEQVAEEIEPEDSGVYITPHRHR